MWDIYLQHINIGKFINGALGKVQFDFRFFREIAHHTKREDLFRLIVEAWEMIPMKTINDYIDYNCDLILQIIENKGEF